jgi:hypothetical protein
MVYKFGRFLQVVGLILLPVAIAGNLAGDPPPLGLRGSLLLSALGVLIFYIGNVIQQAGRSR